jgi:hypothetical protein
MDEQQEEIDKLEKKLVKYGAFRTEDEEFADTYLDDFYDDDLQAS